MSQPCFFLNFILNLHSSDWSVKKKKTIIFCNLVYSGPAITSLLFDTSSSDRVFVTFFLPKILIRVTFLYKKKINKSSTYLMRVSHLSQLCDS